MKKSDLKKINHSGIKFAILVAIVFAFILLYIGVGTSHSSFFEWIKEYVLAYPKLSPVIFTGLFIVSAFFPLPLLTIFGSTIFGFGEVFICSIIGNAINAAIIFYLARWLGRDFVEDSEEKYKTIKKIDTSLKNHPVRDMMLLRFFFPLPVEIGNLAGGLSGIKFKDFMLGTFIGLTPVLIASILLVKGRLIGNGLMEAIAVIMFIILLIIPIVSLASIRKYSKEKCKGVICKVEEFAGLRK